MSKSIINQYKPDYAVLPGDVLAYELELRGMSQKELALRTGVTPKHINEIIQAKAPISPDTALKFERAIGMPADYWLNLERDYQETRVRLIEEQRMEKELDWLERLPVNAITKLGWFAKHKDKKDQLIEVLNFFGIASIDQWDDVWRGLDVAYRKSDKYRIYPEAISAWLRQGEIEARGIDCKPYDTATFKQTLIEIKKLTTKPAEGFEHQLIELCAQAGVAVVFVPCIPNTGVSGATRWLNKDRALIQLSLRYKSDDQLWFTFFHEAGHIIKHGKKEIFLEGNGMSSNKEDEADEFASNFLIPAKTFRQFAEAGVFSKMAIKQFANQLGIAPGIVVGQLQHYDWLPYSHCNDLKRRFKWAHEQG